MTNSKRLYRSRTDKQIAGVCGGLGQYFKVDPTIVRLIFILLAITGGPGLILYIVLALIIPEEPFEDSYYDKPKNDEDML